MNPVAVDIFRQRLSGKLLKNVGKGAFAHMGDPADLFTGDLLGEMGIDIFHSNLQGHAVAGDHAVIPGFGSSNVLLGDQRKQLTYTGADEGQGAAAGGMFVLKLG